MILSCPSCGTRYLVDPTALGSNGRMVRCAKCANTWRQEPPVDMPRRVDVLPPLSGTRAVPAGSNLPVLVERRRRADRIAWLALALLVMLVVAGGLALRDSIVTAWPPSARLYQLLGFDTPSQGHEALGLRFHDVAWKKTVESGVAILVITGSIENVSADPLAVPAIRVGLLDANDQELHHWTFAAATAELAAKTSTNFTSRVTGPPPGATSLSVRFAPAEPG